jgi:diguanylate cyclase (GGDEF)-like protein
LVPGGVLLAAAALLAYSGWLTLPLPALSFLNYCALAGGMVLAWRFHSSRVFLSLLVLFLAGQAQVFYGQHFPISLTLVWMVGVLVSGNFVLIVFMSERGFTLESFAPVGLLLFVQCVLMTVLSNVSAAGAAHAHRPGATIAFPGYVAVILALSATVMAVRFLFTRKTVDAAFLWSLPAFFLSIHFLGTPRIATLYSATAACILAASIVENSYLLAYHDELTGLPSRRAFNDGLLRLRAPYSIAVVDIDHFKSFNDTYGHDVGDQVLRLVATNLARVTGGGQAFRCGGEEFNILFPGKTMPEVVRHLEQLREMVQASEFRMRGVERRQIPRGPDRRSERARGRIPKGHAIRRLAAEKPDTAVSVTVSIGVATAVEKLSPDAVLQRADKALYRAKANGRNRVETTAAARQQRVKAAGIA